MLVYIYTSIILLYIISIVFPSTILSYSIGFLSAIALVFSFRKANGLYFISGACFLSIGVLLFIYNRFPLQTFLLQFETMLGVLSLFLVLPFINSIIRVGLYDKNLSLLLQQKITSLSQLYRRSFVVTHFLALFLNIATIPLLTSTLSRAFQQLPQKTSEKYYSQNLLRAYALCLIWSPFEIMVITSLDLTGNDYYKFFPIIVTILLIIIVSDWLLSYFKYKDIDLIVSDSKNISYKTVYKKMLQMFFVLFIFIILVSFLQQTLNKGFLFSVVILLIPISFAWAAFIGKTKRYLKFTIPHWKDRTNGLANHFLCF